MTADLTKRHDITTEVRHMTRDAQWWSDSDEAVAWADWLNDVDWLNAAWEAGATLGELRERYPYERREFGPNGRFLLVGLPCPDALCTATKRSKWTISHWQCAQVPTYSILWLLPSGRLRLGGKPYPDRDWPGYYASEATWGDLARWPVAIGVSDDRDDR